MLWDLRGIRQPKLGRDRKRGVEYCTLKSTQLLGRYHTWKRKAGSYTYVRGLGKYGGMCDHEEMDYS